MRFRVNFFCTTSYYGVLINWLISASASTIPTNQTTTISTRSTPPALTVPNLATAQTYIYRRTPFEVLRFWSGESLTLRRHDFCAHSREWKSARRNDVEDYDDETRRHKKALRSTRFSLVQDPDDKDDKDKTDKTTLEAVEDIDHTTTPGDATIKDDITNTKINGYTLYDDMTKIVAEMANEVNVTVHKIGQTIEVHDIVMLQMRKTEKRYFRAQDDKYVKEDPQKKIILIVHGLSPLGFRYIPCLYNRESFLDLLKIYAEHLDHFDIFVIPMGNPDGIMDDTLFMWNKNKAPQSDCAGVLVDRNFDVHWDKNHGINGCSWSYPGAAPFSVSESRAVADLMHHYSHRIQAYIHVHAGTLDSSVFKGDAVLYPKGYQDNIDNKYFNIEAAIEEKIRNAGFRNYGVSVTSLYKWYGRVTGTSVDYASTIYGIPYAFEFVMQAYEDDEIHDSILQAVWDRVISTVFTTIYNSGRDGSSVEDLD